MNQLELTKYLSEQCHNYYDLDNPIIDDAVYDKLYDELSKMESTTGIIYPNSPTQKVQGQVVEGLTKVKHSKSMLSCAKTKDINEAFRFCNKDPRGGIWASLKLDGLTVVLRYKNGELVQAVTRGNGIEGEDVTHNAYTIQNLPLTIPYQKDLELRGECLISYTDFVTVNKDDMFANPRNCAAGSLRQLDSKVAKQRLLSCYIFDVVSVIEESFIFKSKQMEWLQSQGFETVIGKRFVDFDDLQKFLADVGKDMTQFGVPIDGVVLEYDNLEFGKSLGATAHHENRHLAFKFNDDVQETTFRGVELCTGRNGTVSITAIFDPVEIEGTTVSRASLHNVDIFNSLELGLGDTITVYKANQIIPQVRDNLTRSGGYPLPSKCPMCGADLVISKEVNTHILKCTGGNCTSALLQRFVQFCSKDGLNIIGLGEAQLQVFIEKGWLTRFDELLDLYVHKEEMKQLEGFGERSVEKLWANFDNAFLHTDLAHVITALGIPGVGKTMAKLIAEDCNWDFVLWKCRMKSDYLWYDIPSVGIETASHIYEWVDELSNWLMLEGMERMLEVGDMVCAIPKKVEVTNSVFADKTFCITGTFDMGSRSEIVKKIEALGGKSVSSVSNKTDILLAGRDCGSKLQKAQNGHTRIIYEEELKELLKNV